VGRFISQDPSGFAAGDPNLYRYVTNSPMDFTDPTGFQGVQNYPDPSQFYTREMLVAAMNLYHNEHISQYLAQFGQSGGNTGPLNSDQVATAMDAARAIDDAIGQEFGMKRGQWYAEQARQRDIDWYEQDVMKQLDGIRRQQEFAQGTLTAMKEMSISVGTDVSIQAAAMGMGPAMSIVGDQALLALQMAARSRQGAIAANAMKWGMAKVAALIARAGQNHHGISRAVYDALQRTGWGKVYKYQDKRFVAEAADLMSHYGYERWHIDLDAEIVKTIAQNAENWTEKNFEAFLRWRYSQPDLIWRFPNGFNPAP
jgi:hypothetical protein